MKSIINLKQALFLSFILCVNGMFAQEIIPDEVADTKPEAVVQPKKVGKLGVSPGAKKIDGVAAVIGEYIVLESDVDNTILQLKAQGVNTDDFTDCELFGKLLEDKLYSHQAIQDSIIVSDIEIHSFVEQQVQRFLQQTNGSMDALLKLYNKEDEKSFRDEMFEINKSQKLAQLMQEKIVEEVEITPEEVREFFNKIPEDERPTFGTELRVAQIVVEPEVTEEEKQKVIDRLKEMKADVIENGASFRSKVVLYTDDAASRGNGGLYTLNRKQPKMVKEFRQVAFSLEEGEISEPFATEYGYHIIYLEKIRGQEYDVRHVLLMPKVSDEEIKKAKEKIDKVRQELVDEEITFEEAAKKYSDEKETKFDGGQLINPATQDYNFELTKMDPELYAQIQSLKDNEISLVLKDEDRTGRIKFKVLTVTDRVDEHVANYAQDYLKIKELALDEKRLNAIEKWQEETIGDTYIKISGDYRDCDFASNWLKK
ncbi:survival protein SurA precursor (peptidyl-prolyl cis-trans isomerase SurA) [Formosa agariphila KMM 3901]|uniref:Survival protein SurA (Peptidyl-prolyl cis-trans isomerase SurA) n=1 Tax=Formosa agariphila (strain DSM 15362 / KCTC 12365 / LMG 23005 / KMM 3901 / M-2Alg 35-1) TaxID=1347342 RepID=T2KJJ2_FORAG|nr:peptidylprolyl isomerase [Formosa agariphila]CDF78591.1 survival protein SurA precursor (peptidyl-prolyl cis-trans isomerase SurA) [Formosa agariphila KMM 3901]